MCRHVSGKKLSRPYYLGAVASTKNNKTSRLEMGYIIIVLYLLHSREVWGISSFYFIFVTTVHEYYLIPPRQLGCERKTKHTVINKNVHIKTGQSPVAAVRAPYHTSTDSLKKQKSKEATQH